MSPGERPGLNRQRVVAAALDIVDREGVKGLTMRALGRELGVDPMAAYHHVPNKEAVLDGVVEAVWAELEVPERSDGTWQSQLEEVARLIRATLRRHPNALPVMASRPNLSTPGFEVVDHILGILFDAGLPPKQALEFVNAAGEFLLGHALAETSPPLPHGDEHLVEALHEADSVKDLPNLRRTLDEVDVAQVTMDTIFEAGLTALSRGVEAQIDGVRRSTVRRGNGLCR